MITESATAKINLFLHITGKRDDNYHTLQSLVIFPPIKDTVTVKRSKDLSLEITGPYADDLWAAASIEDNLVIRAARAIQNHMGHDKGAHITLDKQIPIAAGVGGGSADAAATLRALLQHWKHSPDVSTVRSLALGLGADVPACLASQAAIMTGIGEVLSTPPRVPYMHMVLANPGVGVSTTDVFNSVSVGRAAKKGEVKIPKDFGTQRKLINFLKKGRNDLQVPAVRAVPEIKTILSSLERQPDCQIARMSGSGTTCFGIFKNEDSARAAQSALQEANPNWWVVATKT